MQKMFASSILSDMTVVEFWLAIEHSQLYENNSQEGDRHEFADE